LSLSSTRRYSSATQRGFASPLRAIHRAVTRRFASTRVAEQGRTMLSSPPPGPVPASDAASDAALIAAVAGRDRGAFVALFERYAGRIKAFALRRGASPADADEIAQDVMVSIWRRAGTFDPARAPAAAWIFAIARNRRIDFARAAARPGPDPLDPIFQPEPEPDGFRVLDAAEREARLRDALSSLSAAQRRVIVASFFDGLSHGEIAVREGVPLGTVKSRIRLAFRHLHGVLGVDLAEGFDE
jgi:RNA polymerase sigma-70 factor (ECF subfamily)